MNKNALTLLGCSGSLAFMLTVADLAIADTAKFNDTTAPETAGFVDITFSAPTTSAPTTSAPTTTSQDVTPSRSLDPQYTNVDSASDTVGDLAIAKFRCDCNPCRIAVIQMLQTGQLSL